MLTFRTFREMIERSFDALLDYVPYRVYWRLPDVIHYWHIQWARPYRRYRYFIGDYRSFRNRYGSVRRYEGV